MAVFAGVRIGWPEVPERIRDWVAEMLGSSVVDAVSQSGGFSPGAAERLTTADGRRAFVKAGGTVLNPETPGIYRREGRFSAALPAGTPAPRLLGTYDDGDWVALLFTDVDGRHPVTPWRALEFDAVHDAVATMSAALTPSPIGDLAPASEAIRDMSVSGWRRLIAEPPVDMDSWLADRLHDCLAESERLVDQLLVGDTLVHLDIRADNLLIEPDGEVTVLDWAHLHRGPPWLDPVMLLIDVATYGGEIAVEPALRRVADRCGIPIEDAAAVLIAFLGFFLDRGRDPDVPGLPTLRAFQRTVSAGLVAWLRNRA